MPLTPIASSTASDPGCDKPGRVFVGQRKDPFFVNLGEIFDLVNLNPVGPRDGQHNSLTHYNVTAIALEVPIKCLTSGKDPVIGAWTTASIRKDSNGDNDGMAGTATTTTCRSPGLALR